MRRNSHSDGQMLAHSVGQPIERGADFGGGEQAAAHDPLPARFERLPCLPALEAAFRGSAAAAKTPGPFGKDVFEELVSEKELAIQGDRRHVAAGEQCKEGLRFDAAPRRCRGGWRLGARLGARLQAEEHRRARFELEALERSGGSVQQMHAIAGEAARLAGKPDARGAEGVCGGGRRLHDPMLELLHRIC